MLGCITRNWLLIAVMGMGLCSLGRAGEAASAAGGEKAAGDKPATDTVVYTVEGGQKKTVSGKIAKDAWDEVEVGSGGAGVPIKRHLVVSVKYVAAPSELYDGIDACEAENYPDALESLAAAATKINNITDQQKPLILQYAMYYTGLAYLRTEKYKEATEAFNKALATNTDSKGESNSAFLFAAKLGQAEALELDKGKEKDASDKYKMLAAEFKQRNAPVAAPFAVIAAAGAIRVGVKQAIALVPGPERDTKLAEADAAIEALVKQNQNAFNDESKLALKRLRGLIWEGQGKLKELVEFLDREILAAQNRNDKINLKDFYFKRADANFGLKRYNEALFDYLRLRLVYEVDAKEKAKIQCRSGICFMEIKQPDWMNRADRELLQAQAASIEPWSKEAAAARKTLDQQRGEAGKDAPKDAPKEAAKAATTGAAPAAATAAATK